MVIQEFPIGCYVMTPLGRPAQVVKHIFGKRGDLPRCLVRYVDCERQTELRIVPELLKKIEFDNGKK